MDFARDHSRRGDLGLLRRKNSVVDRCAGHRCGMEYAEGTTLCLVFEDPLAIVALGNGQ